MALTTANLSGVVINEIGNIPFGNLSDWDLNGDGFVDAEDEFIELYNTGGAAVDISGWQVWESGVLKDTIDPGTTLQPGDHFVLVDGYDEFLDNGPIQNVSGAAAQYTDVELTLDDSDVIILYDPGSQNYVVFQGFNADGAAVASAITALEAGNPGDSPTQVGSTEQGQADNLGTTTSRATDGDATWVDQGLTVGAANCFGEGTRIATPDGDRAVETLAPGDLVLTADGRAVPVRFVFRQEASDERAAVRMRAGALGDGLPVRDLVVTADHGMILDGLLINAGALANGRDVVFEPGGQTWYHVETEAHEALLAEGVAAESFVDCAGRAAFDNFDAYLRMYGAERLIVEMDLPRVTSRRLLPGRLLERAA